MAPDPETKPKRKALAVILMALASAICALFSFLLLFMGGLGMLFQADSPPTAMDYKIPLFSGIALFVVAFMIIRRLMRRTSGTAALPTNPFTS